MRRVRCGARVLPFLDGRRGAAYSDLRAQLRPDGCNQPAAVEGLRDHGIGAESLRALVGRQLVPRLRPVFD